MVRLLVPALVAATIGAPAEVRGDQGPTVVEVTIRHSRFVPDRIRVGAGQTVRFEIRNLDPIDHEFILGDREVQERHERGTEPHHGDVPGEVSIPAGAEAATTYTFRAPGTLVYGCHLPGHWAYGMRGTVRVG